MKVVTDNNWTFQEGESGQIRLTKAGKPGTIVINQSFYGFTILVFAEEGREEPEHLLHVCYKHLESEE